jgi:peptide deformylase
MKKTLEVENGVGIAAPQVGISKNLFLFMQLDLPLVVRASAIFEDPKQGQITDKMYPNQCSNGRKRRLDRLHCIGYLPGNG